MPTATTRPSSKELHNKVLNQSEEINRLREEEGIGRENIKNYLGDLLRAVNLMQQGLQEKKHKMDQIDSGLKQIQDALAKWILKYDKQRSNRPLG